MIEHMKKIDTLIEPLRKIADNYAYPVLDLGIRLYMANIFLKSGWPKLMNAFNGTWQNTVNQFTNAHALPGVDPNIAAIAGTGGEVILPALLIVGLFTRFGAGGLLIMTLVIEFFAYSDFGFGQEPLSNPIHYFWMFMLAVPFLKGPSKLSIDYWLVKFIRKS